MRVDGSSKFSEGNKYGYFPSFSFAWRVINENFLKDSNVFNDLKFRAGWGQVGNQGIQPYQTLTNYGIVPYGEGNGFVPNNIGNNDLTWETTEQKNIGIDFSLFKNKIRGTVDAYIKETSDLLQLQQIPASSGFSSLLVNGGDIENKGLEFSLSSVLLDNKKDFKIEVSGNIAFNRSKITNLDNPEASIFIDGVEQQRSFYLGDRISSGGFFSNPGNIFIQGEEIGMFYGWETNGIWQTTDTDIIAGFVPGDVRIVDQNNDGLINAVDRTIIGNPNPDFVYGGSLNMNYKRLSLQVLVNGVYGNEIANGSSILLRNALGLNRNITPNTYNNAWRPDSPSTTNPRIDYNFPQQAEAIEDRIIEDGSFLRISNITLGYDIPVEKTNIFSRVNIFVTGINLFTFTNYSGYNPEITSFLGNGNITGVDWNGAPNRRSAMLGLNLNF
jgi:TonB-linked SusC/RagA family outer membrane protein